MEKHNNITYNNNNSLQETNIYLARNTVNTYIDVFQYILYG